jgi:hypothetical protein
MMLPTLDQISQIPLFYEIHEDDYRLLNSKDNDWFRILYYFPWEDYRDFGAKYYDALYDFNQSTTTNNTNSFCGNNPESKQEAQERLLFDRVTMQSTETSDPKYLFQPSDIYLNLSITVNPNDIAPNIVPSRYAGKKPKCFFSLFKSFLGASLMGFPAEPEKVHLLLKSNPSFIRVCGFSPMDADSDYCYHHVPSLRKLEQFDQIMTEAGLWEVIKWAEVKHNIEMGIIEQEEILVADTTHYHAYSGFETVKYTDDNGKEKKKSQSKVTKKCHCEDKTTCIHAWELADDGAGTVVKSGGKMYWGHKASIIGYPDQGVPLDVIAISDASTFDGKTLYPHVERLFNQLPTLQASIKTVLYDSACDDQTLKNDFMDTWEINLRASMNPRRKKPITEGLPRGIEKITPYGIPVCIAGYEMEYIGIRYQSEQFVYKAPSDDNQKPVCNTCSHKKECSPNSTTGRTIQVSFDTLPYIDTKDPPMSKKFKAMMTKRPSVERMIKQLKCDLSDDRLSKRGNNSFQAHLDKAMIAFHLLYRE